MKILVAGAKGQLGKEIAKQFGGKYDLILHDVDTLDIADYNAVDGVLQSMQPDVVINAAAYTNVEMAEEDIDQAFKINAIGAHNLAITAKKNHAKLFQISTDYVFDGQKTSPYNEFDNPAPLSVYGKSKLWGELLVKQTGGDYFILRTSWLYGDGHNFVHTILRLAEQKDELSVVADQYGTPTYTKDLVWVIEKLIHTDFYGIYHASNNGICTWYEFAKKIFTLTGKTHNVKPLRTDEYPTKAQRPMYSVMENRMLHLRGFNVMRSWEEALEDYINNEYKYTVEMGDYY